MNCIKCGCHCTERMLHRTTPFGEDPDWTCMPCIERHEPELAKNIKADDDIKLLNILNDQSIKQQIFNVLANTNNA